jgi:hypothetical protein
VKSELPERDRFEPALRPKSETAATHTIATRATRNAYSTSVAPDSRRSPRACWSRVDVRHVSHVVIIESRRKDRGIMGWSLCEKVSETPHGAGPKARPMLQFGETWRLATSGN